VPGCSDLGDVGVELDRMRVLPILEALGSAFAESAVEFTDQFVDRAVSIISVGGGDDIGAAYFDLPLGGELAVVGLGFVVFDVDPDAVDSGLMAEKLGGLFADVRFERISQV